MTRDMELIREILLAAEAIALPEPPHYHDPSTAYLEIPGHSTIEVARHVELLVDAGLVRAHFVTADGIPGPVVAQAVRLTWSGHEFLSASRNETVWRRALAVFRDKGIDVTFSALQEVLKQGVKQVLGSGES